MCSGPRHILGTELKVIFSGRPRISFMMRVLLSRYLSRNRIHILIENALRDRLEPDHIVIPRSLSPRYICCCTFQTLCYSGLVDIESLFFIQKLFIDLYSGLWRLMLNLMSGNLDFVWNYCWSFLGKSGVKLLGLLPGHATLRKTAVAHVPITPKLSLSPCSNAAFVLGPSQSSVTGADTCYLGTV